MGFRGRLYKSVGLRLVFFLSFLGGRIRLCLRVVQGFYKGCEAVVDGVCERPSWLGQWSDGWMMMINGLSVEAVVRCTVPVV